MAGPRGADHPERPKTAVERSERPFRALHVRPMETESGVVPAPYGGQVPRLSSFYGIVVYMYWSDHPPPHFHAEYGEDQALVVIADGSVFAGSLPRRARRLVEEWRALHLEDLHAAWDLASEREDPGTIEPLP